MKSLTLKKIILIAIILSAIIANYSFAMGPAISVGTENNTEWIAEDKEYSTITTTSLTEFAADCYSDCGYATSKKIKDPSYMLLLSNSLASEIQLYSTHGSIDSVTFTSNTGICTSHKTVGNIEYVGLNTLKSGWESNCKFVMYMACNTGGISGNASTESLCYLSTTDGAVPASFGFKKTVSYSRGLEPWAENFNKRLAKGYGVKSSLDYANMFLYLDEDVKSWHYVYNSSKIEENFKLGTYYGKQEIIPIDTTMIEKKKNILNNNIFTKEEIVDEIKKYDENFDLKNYEIKENKSTISEINNDGETINTTEIKNISYILKVGDFITDAGYVVSIIEDKIVGIYDNNIDLDKQNKILKNLDNYKVNLSEEKISKYMRKSENVINSRYNLQNSSSNEDNIKYFYDIEIDKKYIVIEVESEINGDKAIDIIEYEI